MTKAGGKLYADTPINMMRLLADTTLTGERVELISPQESGFRYTIDGDLVATGIFYDDIQVNGDLIVETGANFNKNAAVTMSGDLVVEGRLNLYEKTTIDIGGDFRVQKRTEDGTYGETAGFLVQYDSSKITVTGDVYYQSINDVSIMKPEASLELHGDFHQVGTNTYFLPGGGKIIFSGEEDQHISFDRWDNRSYLGSVQVTKAGGKLYADTSIYGMHLLADTTLTGERVELISPQESGFRYTIDGDLIATGNFYDDVQVSGDLVVETGAYFNKNVVVTVNGDLRIQKRAGDGTYAATSGALLLNDFSKMLIKGNTYSQSISSRTPSIAAGASLELYGNLFQVGDTYFCSGGNNGKLVFAGNGEQHVSFDNNSVNASLKNVTQLRRDASIVLDTPVSYISAGGELVFKGGAQVGQLYAGGNAIRFRNNAAIGTVSLSGGILTCDGNLTITGTLDPGGGAASVKGDLHQQGSINMNKSSDLLLVSGNFYAEYKYLTTINNGILDIKGDFVKTDSSTFTSGANALVQFTGAGPQIIEFPVTVLGKEPNVTYSANVRFTNLGINKGMDSYTFSMVPCWQNLYEAVETSGVAAQISQRQLGRPGVYAPTGNYSRTDSDMHIETVLGTMELARTYNSLDSVGSSVVGKGFTFSHNMKITTAEYDSSIKTVILPTGMRWAFRDTGKGSFKALDSRGVLTKDGEGYILKTLDKKIYSFQANGNIEYMEDGKGNRLSFHTSESGNITEIYDVSGASVTFLYSNGKIVQIINNVTGDSVHYTYSGDNLIEAAGAGGRITRYEYNGASGLLSRVVANDGVIAQEITYIDIGESVNKVHTLKDASGNIKSYEYHEDSQEAVITDSSGRIEYQSYDNTRNVTSVDNALHLSERVTYVLTDGVNRYGEPQRVQDAYSNVTTYDRDAKGNVTQITYPDGGTERYTYDSYNNITKSVDRAGAATFFIYDDQGQNLLKMVQPLNGTAVYSESADQEQFAITEYTYYAVGEDGCGIHGLVKTVVGPNGDDENYTAFLYDAKGRITSQTVYIDGVGYETNYEYDPRGLLLSEEAPDGVRTEYAYNASGELLRKTVSPADRSQATVERIRYDAMGRVLQEIGPAQYQAGLDNLSADSYGDPNAGICYTYDTAGNVTAIRDALGNVVTKDYDYYGNVLRESKPEGSYSSYTYDAVNRKLTTAFYDSASGKTTLIEENEYIYQTITPKVRTTTYYDDSRTGVTEIKYDYAGRAVETTNAAGGSTHKTYNKGGAISTSRDEMGLLTSYTYDGRGNLILVAAPFNGNDKAQTKYAYDRAGNVISTQVLSSATGAASWRKTEFSYDAWNRLTLVTQYDGARPSGYVQNYYDYKGQLLRQYKGMSAPLTITGLDQISGGDYSVTKYAYDYLGNVTETADALNQTETFIRDAAGRVISSRDRNGIRYTAEYDALDRVVREQYDKSGGEAITTTYAYDANGNLLSTNENGLSVRYAYNGWDQLIEEHQDGIDKYYAYDNIGAMVSGQIIQGGSTVWSAEYTYDNLGRLSNVRDQNGRTADYTYDPSGRPVTTTYANGITETRTYNQGGQVTLLVNQGPNGELSRYAYTYSVDGNQLSKTGPEGETLYTYDGLNRLSKVTNPGNVVETYGYDLNGNRISKVTSGSQTDSETYTYDLNNRLIGMTNSEGSTSYVYDGNGNLLTQRGAGGDTDETYDLKNRMVSYSGGGSSASYEYSPDGMRSAKTVDGVTTRQLWVGGNIAAELTGGDAVTYTHGLQLVAGSYGYYLYNAHGDVVELTDESGQVTQEYDYDPFGIEKGEPSPDPNPFRYAGEYTDFESGYVYLRARYYAPGLGRFLSEDPHWTVSNMVYGDDPLKLNERKDNNGNSTYSYVPDISSILQSGNLYVYGLNNPILYVDENGEWIHLVVGAVVGAAVGAIASGITQYITTGEVKLSTTLIAAGGGAVSGALAASGAGLVGQIIGNGVISGATNIVTQVNEGKNINTIDGWSVTASVGLGMIAGRIGGSGANTNNYLGSLSNRLITRLGNAFQHKAGESFVREATNAFSYFVKSSQSTYINMVENIGNSYLPSIIAGGAQAINKLSQSIRELFTW